MKAHPKPTFLLMAVGFWLGVGLAPPTLVLALPAPAPTPAEEEEEEDEKEETEERPEMSSQAVRQFLKEHVPEALEVLTYVRREEGREDYEDAWERAEDFVVEYHEILADEGQEEAQSLLRFTRLEMQIEQLGIAWRETRSRRAKTEIRQQLEARITEQFDLELAVSRRELDELRLEVNAIQAEIRELETDRETLIAREIREILNEDEEEQDEEEQDEEEEDEEE